MAVSFVHLGVRAPLSPLPEAFQFGGRTYSGAILISPPGIYAWPTGGENDSLAFLDEMKNVRGDFLLLGTGSASKLPSASFREHLDRLSLGLEWMDTNAACRTYNVLLAENRFFCAAMLPL